MLDKTCWGIFNNLIMSIGAWQKTSNLQSPQTALRRDTTAPPDWTAYPLSDQRIPAYVEELAYFCCELSVIANDINQLLYNDKPQTEDISPRVLALHARLVAWQTSLPSHLTLSPTASAPVLTQQLVSVFAHALPNSLTKPHRAYYQTLIITLLAPLTNLSPTNPHPTAAATHWRREAALTVVRTIRLHQSHYSMSHMSIFLIQPVMNAAFVLIDFVDPSDSDISTYKSEIIDLCVFFRAMSRRYLFATAALRLFQLTVQRKGRKLPTETEKLFEDFENRDWKVRALGEVKSVYPAVADRVDGREDVRTMSEVFQKFEGLSVQDEGGECKRTGSG